MFILLISLVFKINKWQIVVHEIKFSVFVGKRRLRLDSYTRLASETDDWSCHVTR